ncbi:MAG: DinB family protein [Bryobacteraceae bacterium]
MPISQMLLPEFDQEMMNTRKVLERVPDDKLEYKPHVKSMTLGRLAGHVAELPNWATHTLQMEELTITGDFKPFIPKSRQEILDTFDKHVGEAREVISKATDDDWGKTWTLKFGEETIMSMPRTAVLRNMVISHLIHHRGQLGVYLRLNEVEIPGMYGPSADEMQFWNQKAAAAKQTAAS